MKKKIAVSVVIAAIFVWAYLVFIKKDKTLWVSKNADLVVLADVKKLSNYYLLQWISNPAEWFSQNREESISKINLKNSGFKIPDYFAVFHLQNTPISQWYSVLDIEDLGKVKTCLAKEKFVEKSPVFFQAEFGAVLFIKNKALFSSGKNISEAALQQKAKILLSPENQNSNLLASDFMTDSHGSLSFISGKKITSYPINLKKDFIELGTLENEEDFNALSKQLHQTKSVADARLDKNALLKFQNFGRQFLGLKNPDSLSLKHFSATAEIQETTEKIITYEYDDNFNEVEKISEQKTLSPVYILQLESYNPEKTITYFQHHKWMNPQNEFVKIPFLPNEVKTVGETIYIRSRGEVTRISTIAFDSHFYFRNNEKWWNSFKSLSKKEKKWLLEWDSFLWVMNQSSPYFRLQFRKQNLPFILR